MAKSVMDYVLRRLGDHSIEGYHEANFPHAGQQELPLKDWHAEEGKHANKAVSELARNPRFEPEMRKEERPSYRMTCPASADELII